VAEGRAWVCRMAVTWLECTLMPAHRGGGGGGRRHRSLLRLQRLWGAMFHTQHCGVCVCLQLWCTSNCGCFCHTGPATPCQGQRSCSQRFLVNCMSIVCLCWHLAARHIQQLHQAAVASTLLLTTQACNEQAWLWCTPITCRTSFPCTLLAHRAWSVLATSALVRWCTCVHQCSAAEQSGTGQANNCRPHCAGFNRMNSNTLACCMGMFSSTCFSLTAHQ
jgi:hypothetical protein